MTSRRSRPQPSSGSRAALAALALTVCAGVAAHAADGFPRATLVDRHDSVEVDWAAGTVTATGGAAADLRMPSADVARVGALRRAEAVARARLTEALGRLPAGGGQKLDAEAVTRALGRAHVTGTDLQSNGGAFVHVAVRFADWIDAAPPADAAPVVVLSVGAMGLAATPVAQVTGQSPARPIGAAIYRLGEPPAGVDALPAKVDKRGHLDFALGRDKAVVDKLAKGTALIYVRTPSR